MGLWDIPARRVVTDTELRFNPYHNPINGRFCSGKGLDNSSKPAIIKLKDIPINKNHQC